MNAEKELTTASLIQIFDAPATKPQIVEALAKRLFADGRIADGAAFAANVLGREKDGMTGLVKGVAIPHAKMDSVRVPSVAIARLSTPIDWPTFDRSKVHTVFLLAGNNDKRQSEQNRQIALLMRQFSEDSFFDEIEAAADAATFYKLIAKTIKQIKER